jgi:hypothetical protein
MWDHTTLVTGTNGHKYSAVSTRRMVSLLYFLKEEQEVMRSSYCLRACVCVCVVYLDGPNHNVNYLTEFYEAL